MTQHSTEFLELQAALAGEYSLQRELGRGGMGIVYLARDVQLDRDVAIKVLPPDLARTPESRERFIREARTAAGLSHPHIVPIHRVGEATAPAKQGAADTRFVFFVMSYVEGETHGDRLRTNGPLPPAEAARVLREVAWALAYAHGRGIVHRDVKPDNILLEAGTGRALVTDFGIAQRQDVGSPDATPGKIMGTAHFMSPEQAAGNSIDGRSDLYSLGVVGYLALSGRLPFESTALPALMVRQATEAPQSVLQVAPGIARELGAAIDRCLALDPADRFTDGEALAAALVPGPDTRPALPPTLRAWLGARNPLLVPFSAWSAGFSVLTIGNAVALATGNRGSHIRDVAILGSLALAPLVPIIGFHLNQARRQFRAGHTLADLRTAIELARRDRVESEALARDEEETAPIRLLRLSTVASATWLAVTFGLIVSRVLNEHTTGIAWILAPIGSTMLLGAASNAFDVQFLPTKLRQWWQTGIRDRLWNSRVGEWFARRLGAPDRSRAVGGGVFRPTEAALGVAASELFAALPRAYREQLSDLPAIVAALEARAAEARAEIDIVAALAPNGSSDAEVLAARRTAASTNLAQTVAALEGIRLDLLRLHAGASDLAPLTTLIDAARALDEDVNRLADAQREVNAATSRKPLGTARTPTPA
jgi:tRNA A-37 threonylcarbamoyl transferase component Bud32